MRNNKCMFSILNTGEKLLRKMFNSAKNRIEVHCKSHN